MWKERIAFAKQRNVGRANFRSAKGRRRTQSTCIYWRTIFVVRRMGSFVSHSLSCRSITNLINDTVFLDIPLYGPSSLLCTTKLVLPIVLVVRGNMNELNHCREIALISVLSLRGTSVRVLMTSTSISDVKCFWSENLIARSNRHFVYHQLYTLMSGSSKLSTALRMVDVFGCIWMLSTSYFPPKRWSSSVIHYQPRGRCLQHFS